MSGNLPLRSSVGDGLLGSTLSYAILQRLLAVGWPAGRTDLVWVSTRGAGLTQLSAGLVACWQLCLEESRKPELWRDVECATPRAGATLSQHVARAV